jgi:hypothetical protein
VVFTIPLLDDFALVNPNDYSKYHLFFIVAPNSGLESGITKKYFFITIFTDS